MSKSPSDKPELVPLDMGSSHRLIHALSMLRYTFQNIGMYARENEGFSVIVLEPYDFNVLKEYILFSHKTEFIPHPNMRWFRYTGFEFRMKEEK